jgi:hypothetical protein
MNMKDKARKAAIKYLDFRGYKILDEDFDGFVFAFDGDTIHIIEAFVDKSTKSRKDYEQAMVKWLACHDDYLDVFISVDQVILTLVGSSKALLKHVIM